jgi:V/A-type H+-transporting ATPase subunit A
MDRTVLVVNTSNMPVAAREASIYTAVTLGEYYRDLGFHVLLLADSISRWAEALREISCSLEEMPGEEGYPTYLASRLSSFVERAGVVETLSGDIGSLSMILSVSPPGGDFTEPVTQALLRTSGAFLMLDTTLANSRHFPAINWMQSYSLYQNILENYFRNNVSGDWEILRTRCREIMHKEESLKEIMEIIGIEGLQEKDRLVMQVAEKIRGSFLAQNAYTADAFCDPRKTLDIIRSMTEEYAQDKEK